MSGIAPNVQASLGASLRLQELLVEVVLLVAAEDRVNVKDAKNRPIRSRRRRLERPPPSQATEVDPDDFLL